MAPATVRSERLGGMELLIARNPDTGSSLPFLMLVPVAGGLVFRTKGTWPRTTAVYCHPVPRSEWSEQPDLVEQIPLRVCQRRGAAIDIVADRGREQRCQLVFTAARGREVVFWQAPRTRKQARPAVRVPAARAAGLADLRILIDAHEQYPYRFSSQQVSTLRRGLACGDYAVEHDQAIVAAVERKSLADLMTSLTSGRLRYALGELAGLPRAAVVVEDRYSQIFAQSRVRPALVADRLAELQVRWPTVPLVFCETRKLAEEWTYRYLAAEHTRARDELDITARIFQDRDRPPAATDIDVSFPPPSTAEIRAWARTQGYTVSDRGRLRPEITAAWRDTHPESPPQESE